MILHILNGDCALNSWKECSFTGEAIVWRENYLIGAVPEFDNSEKFFQLRAEELHKTAPNKTVNDNFEELQFMHKKLFSLRSSDTLVLWLDYCPFDQALKKQLLKLIRTLPEKPELFLVQQDVVWNKDAFEKHRDFQDRALDFISF